MDNFNDNNPYKNYNTSERDGNTSDTDTATTETATDESVFKSGSGGFAPSGSSSNPYSSAHNPYGNENPSGNSNPYSSAYNPYTSSANGDDGDKEPKKSKGLGIASMVLGIASLTICCCSGGLFPAIIGLILGIVAQVKNPSGFALAGIITSAFGIAFGLLGFFSIVLNAEFWEEFMREFEDVMNSSFFDDSSFNNNNNAFINLLKLIKTLVIG